MNASSVFDAFGEGSSVSPSVATGDTSSPLVSFASPTFAQIWDGGLQVAKTVLDYKLGVKQTDLAKSVAQSNANASAAKIPSASSLLPGGVSPQQIAIYAGLAGLVLAGGILLFKTIR